MGAEKAQQNRLALMQISRQPPSATAERSKQDLVAGHRQGSTLPHYWEAPYLSRCAAACCVAAAVAVGYFCSAPHQTQPAAPVRIWHIDLAAPSLPQSIQRVWSTFDQMADKPPMPYSAFDDAERRAYRAELLQKPNEPKYRKIEKNLTGWYGTPTRTVDIQIRTRDGTKPLRWQLRFGKYGFYPDAQREVRAVAAEVFGRLPTSSAVDGGFSGMQGAFYYPAGGFREWHTNEHDQVGDGAGWRLYLVKVSKPNASHFVYLDDEGRPRFVPDQNYSGRLFKLQQSAPWFWHGVHSSTDRWSLGISISSSWAQYLLEQGSAIPIIDTVGADVIEQRERKHI